MKALSQTMITVAFGAVVSAALSVPTASAGCGFDSARLPGIWEYRQLHASVPFASRVAESNNGQRNGVGPATIVGMWKIEFVSKGNTSHNPPIPDAALIDFGYAQWHSDGTEWMNSGTLAPATQNFCMGVWQQTAHDTYQLNHFALSYDAVTGNLKGRVRIQESVSLAPGGNGYTGTFIIDAFDLQGNPTDHVTGEVNGERVTVDTITP